MSSDGWIEANRRYLLAALAGVKNTVRRAVETAQPGSGQPAPAIPTAEDDAKTLEAAGAAMPAPPALETLVEALGLSPFERGGLLLCAGVQLDTRFGAD